MTFTQEFAQALRHQTVLMKHRPDRLRVQIPIYLAWLLSFGLLFATIQGLHSGQFGTASWWADIVPRHMLLSLCITLCFLAGFRGFERLAPQRWLDTITAWRDWRAGVFFTALSLACSVVGVVVGFAAVDVVWLSRNVQRLLGQPDFWLQFIALSAVISFVMGLGYRARWKQEQLQARITEAQLKLLQGQIEPHFLFNTLANVQSLIDFDPPTARLMLERFTDYLRASLGQLRGDSTTLGQEFATLEAYLALMQLRMGERLRIDLALPPELSGIELPPLLAQPLVENAIHHGLEPRIAGGTLAVSARRDGGRLWIEVADDGQGLDAERSGFQRRTGQGVALANIRARLAARYGNAARLDLLPRDTGSGTLARIQIPLPTPTP